MNVSKCIVLESGSALRSPDREPTDSLWQRVALLAREEQVLLELSLRGGASTRQIARLLNRSPGAVSRHLQRLGRRLHDPLVLALLHPKCPLDPEHCQIGVERFLCATGIPHLAKRHELTPARVRNILLLIRCWHRGVSRSGRSHHADD